MNIYVGNLSHEVTEDDLRQAFEAFGEVESTNIVRDKFSGESRGFGFVLMSSREQASAAITGMDNKELKERNVKVAEARPRTSGRRASGRRPSGRRGGFGGGRGGDRGGFGGGHGRGGRY